jgi:CheY-like chemotaxis protein
MSGRACKILNIAKNEFLHQSRAAILQSAGHEVIPALDTLQVQAQCEKHPDLDLVIIGYGLPRAEKRRAMRIVRQYCRTIPILELYQPGTDPVDEEAKDQLSAADKPESLLARVNEILSKKRKKQRAAS